MGVCNSLSFRGSETTEESINVTFSGFFAITQNDLFRMIWKCLLYFWGLRRPRFCGLGLVFLAIYLHSVLCCHSETNEVKLKNPEKLNYLYWILRFAQNDWLDVNKSHSASLLMEDGNLPFPRYLVMNNHNQLASKSSI